MSYFVGHKAVKNGYAEDAGFAINGGKGWSDVVFENHKIDIAGDVAIAMGTYVFTNAADGSKATVEYTFGYKRNADGKLRIFLHHSSVPYSPPTSSAAVEVSEDDVVTAQAAWASAIKSISKTYLDGGDYKAAAGKAAGELYGYGHTDVLFKPTKAAEAPFRPTAAEAMSYFVGHEAVETAAAGVAGKRASKGRTSLQAVGVGINGFGRIGRQVARIAMKDPETELKLINASYDADYLAYMMKYDTIHGKYDGTIEVDGDSLVIDGQKVALSHTRDPAEIPFGEHGAEYVCESTGNENTYDPSMKAVSCASCTTNGLAPAVRVLREKFGIKRGLMTTCHAMTASQPTVDGTSKKDWRGGRAGPGNIIPSSTGAAKAVAKVIRM